MLEYSAALQYCSTVLQYSAAVQCCTTVLQYSDALQCFNTVLQYSVASQCYSTGQCRTVLQYSAVLYCCSAVQCCSTVLHYSFSVHCCNIVLQYSAAMHYSAAVQYSTLQCFTVQCSAMSSIHLFTPCNMTAVTRGLHSTISDNSKLLKGFNVSVCHEYPLTFLCLLLCVSRIQSVSPWIPSKMSGCREDRIDWNYPQCCIPALSYPALQNWWDIQIHQ